MSDPFAFLSLGLSKIAQLPPLSSDLPSLSFVDEKGMLIWSRLSLSSFFSAATSLDVEDTVMKCKQIQLFACCIHEWFLSHLVDVSNKNTYNNEPNEFSPLFWEFYSPVLSQFAHQSDSISASLDQKQQQQQRQHSGLVVDAIRLHLRGFSALAFAQLGSYLERFLGDIFHIIEPASPPPRMLRDLFEMKSLSDFIGEPAVAILWLLIGTPHGFNLRNILWHGFLPMTSVGEFGLTSDAAMAPYTSLLILVCFSLAHIAASQHFFENHPTSAASAAVTAASIVVRRPLKKSFPRDAEMIAHLSARLPSVALCKSSFTQADEGHFVVPGRLSEFQFAVEWYEKKHSLCCLTVLLPALEHSLRVLYVKFNNLPLAMLQAQSNLLFTDLDMILNVEVEDPTSRLPPDCMPTAAHCARPNRIWDEDCLGFALCGALWDLLLSRSGCRLRDRVAHGEVRDVPLEFSRLMLSICALSTHRLRNLATPQWEYVCYFSPGAGALRQLQQFHTCLSVFSTTFSSLMQPDKTASSAALCWNEVISSLCTAANLSHSFFTFPFSPQYTECKEMLSFCNNLNTIGLPFFVAALCRIGGNVSLTLTTFQAIFHELSALVAAKQASTRQRKLLTTVTDSILIQQLLQAGLCISAFMECAFVLSQQLKAKESLTFNSRASLSSVLTSLDSLIAELDSSWSVPSSLAQSSSFERPKFLLSKKLKQLEMESEKMAAAADKNLWPEVATRLNNLAVTCGSFHKEQAPSFDCFRPKTLSQ